MQKVVLEVITAKLAIIGDKTVTKQKSRRQGYENESDKKRYSLDRSG